MIDGVFIGLNFVNSLDCSHNGGGGQLWCPKKLSISDVNSWQTCSFVGYQQKFNTTVSKRNYCTQNFRTARCLQHVNLKYIAIKIDISPVKYSSWQEMRAVLFRKACSNSVYWLWYFSAATASLIFTFFGLCTIKDYEAKRSRAGSQYKKHVCCMPMSKFHAYYSFSSQYSLH